jgi:leucyl-tRNA synthetase
VNGKLRAHLSLPFRTPDAQVRELALAHDKVKPFIDGKQIVKVIVLTDKLVNIVVR